MPVEQKHFTKSFTITLQANQVVGSNQAVTQLDKSDVLPGLFGVWDSIDTLLDGLPDEGWQAPTPLHISTAPENMRSGNACE